LDNEIKYFANPEFEGVANHSDTVDKTHSSERRRRSHSETPTENTQTIYAFESPYGCTAKAASVTLKKRERHIGMHDQKNQFCFPRSSDRCSMVQTGAGLAHHRRDILDAMLWVPLGYNAYVSGESLRIALIGSASPINASLGAESQMSSLRTSERRLSRETHWSALTCGSKKNGAAPTPQSSALDSCRNKPLGPCYRLYKA
jgi:hypothetical protein